jgi:hypothetical protein
MFKENVSRFDLEQDIMDCWNITKDLDSLLLAVERGDEDQVMNIIIGLRSLYDLKFEKMFNTFEQCIRNREFDATPATKETAKVVIDEKKKSIEPFGY